MLKKKKKNIQSRKKEKYEKLYTNEKNIHILLSLAETFFFMRSNSIFNFVDYSNLTLHSAIVKIKKLTLTGLNTYTKHKVSSLLTT